MKLTSTEVKKAYKISKAIQHYIEKSGKTNLRSTDVFPYLVRKGLFESDKNNGIHFRRFLRKLDNNGELKTLIPQCSVIPPLDDEINNEWYFHDAKDKMPKTIVKNDSLKLKEANKNSVLTAIEIIQKLVAGVNPINGSELAKSDIVNHPVINKALKMIITPECYAAEIQRLQSELNSEEKIKTTQDWVNKIKNEVDIFKNKGVRQNLNPNQLKVRETYSRAFDFYTKKEKELLIKAWNKCENEELLSEIFKRSPSSILKKIEQLKKASNF